MNIVVVIPSRGRPRQAQAAIESVRDTAVLVATSVVLAVDADDVELPAYRDLVFPGHGPEVTTVVLVGNEGGNLVRAMNTPALRIAGEDPGSIVGVLNDDMRARTPGWDRTISETLDLPGIAYGDDGFQHEALVTSPFISARIVLALGWYALPYLEHQFPDNVWRDLGESARVLHYRPELCFEHLHPFAGKAEWDAIYERGNSQSVIDRDRETYETWRRIGLPEDALRVRGAVNVELGRRTDYSYAGGRSE